ELAGLRPQLAPLHEELAALVEFQNPVVARAVPLGDEDVAVRRGDDVVRLIEIIRRRGAARLAERQQHFAVGAELVYLIAVRCARTRTDRAGRRFAARATAALAAATGAARRNGRVVLAVGHPHVAVAIDVDAVREDQQARAETPHELAARIELQHA